MDNLDDAVKALMSIDFRNEDDWLFTSMLARGFSRINARINISMRHSIEKPAPNWMKALANSSDEEFGREIAIRTFIAERSIENDSLLPDPQIEPAAPAVT